MTTALSPIHRRQLSNLARRKEWAKTVELCQALTPSVHSAELYFSLAQALAHQGNETGAAAAYSRSLALQPHQPEIHCALGVICANQQKWALAICHYEEALRQRPNRFEVLFRLARAFHRLGESARALATYEQVVACQANCAEAYFSMGLLHDQNRDRRAAIKNYRKAVFARPSYVEAHEHLGKALVREKAYGAAEVVYEQAIAACPQSATLHNSFGHLKLSQDKTQPAINAYRQAIALDPTLSSAYKSLGGLYYGQQSLQQAVKYFQKALEYAPESTAATSDYAWVLAEQGRWLDLLTCFRQACVAQPAFITAYCKKARSLPSDDVLFRLQRTCAILLENLLLSDAESAELTSLLPQLAQVYAALGDLSIACDAPARAEQCYRFAMTLVPTAHWHEALGDCLVSQGRRAAAIATYQAGILQGLDDGLLSQKLEATLRTPPVVASEVVISGVYRYTQDWLAQNNLAPARSTPEDFVPVKAVAALDSECGGLTCKRCMGNLIRKFSPTQMGKGVFRCCPTSPDETLAFSAFVTTLPRGRVWIAPQQDAWAVCHEIAVFSPDDFLLGDLSRCYPWYLPGCDRRDIATHTVLQRTSPLPAVQEVSGRVAVLSGLSGHIYYHWLFDVLPRFEVLRKGLSAAVGEPLTLRQSFEYVDYFVVNGLSKPFQKETLMTLGVPLEKVIESDRTPHIRAEELLVPSFAGHLDWVPPSSMDFLREKLHNKRHSTSFLAQGLPAKRLYISRSNAKYRHVFNEDAVVDLLSQCGFVSVALETLSVAQQMTLFSQAEAIVGAHGSGLANLVFCSPGTAVVEMFSPNYLRTDYWMISQYLQLHHYYLVGESFPFHPLRQLMYTSGLTEDFSVDINALRSLLKKLNLMP
ncbi:MAG: glycosyltransferase 61 family protein [Phormidesmis sp.]